MNFKRALEPVEKLQLLGNAAKYEPAGGSPLDEQLPRFKSGKPKPLPCISEVSTPSGKKPVVKAMMTTACERNCYYCPFRAGRKDTERVQFTPDEMVAAFNVIERSGQADGMFLSSGIVGGSVRAQDSIIDTAEIMRQKYEYRGYIHLKIMPGAEHDQIRRAMQLADRVSVNLEGPTEQRLAKLAPTKDYWRELIQRLQWISRLRKEEQLRASVVTQFVVGAVGDTDLELLQISDNLYNQMGLKRTYFSGFSPILDTPFENLPSTPDLRQFRLYQASFLLRDYGWLVEEMPFQPDTNLRLDTDPKLAWAEQNLKEQPVDLNTASRSDLLRVPGIGPVFADRILNTRRGSKLTELAHLRKLGLRDVGKTAPFILLNGRQPAHQLALI